MDTKILRPSRSFWRLLLPQAILLLAGGLLALAALLGMPAEIRARLLLVAALGITLGIGLAIVFSRWLAHQLEKDYIALTAAVQRVGSDSELPPLPDRLDEAAPEVGLSLATVHRQLRAQISRLEEDRQQLRTILSGMVEGVVALDADQRILFANDRAGDLLELPARPAVGRRFWEVVRQRPLLDAVRRALDQPEPAREEFAWNGDSRSLAVHAARLPGTPPRGAVLVLHDTTELRRLERLRQDFVANVSHELKTPLSVIKACVETLIDGAVDDTEHRGQFLERIAEQSDRLHNLILDLLSLARIEGGDERFEFQPVQVAEIVHGCLERHQARAEARQQTLTVAADTNSELSAWADEEAVDQILDNLVDNAMKYTPEGGQVCVTWKVEGDQVCLSVADTGIGIPEHDLPRIFERFYRVDKARSRQLGGTGLGLSIVKHLAQAMRGSVRATSVVGQGTTFLVTLPRAQAA